MGLNRISKIQNFDALSLFFGRFLLLWIAFIVVSPGFGIHVHHVKPGKIIFHSYLFADHDTNHPATNSPPESLTDHLIFGLATDLKGWDAGPQSDRLRNFAVEITFLFINVLLTFLSVYSIIFQCFSILLPAKKFGALSVFQTPIHFFLEIPVYRFSLPPPSDF